MTENHNMRILIIAPDPLARAGLTALLASESRLTIVGQIAPGEDVAAQAQTYQPDVVLWDLGWNPTTSLETLAEFAEVGPPVLALVADEAGAGEVWAAGVRGLLLREVEGEALFAAIAALGQELVVLESALAGALSVASSAATPQPLIEALTARELEVLRGLAEGLSNKQIARNLKISEHTVKFHVNAILGKLGAQSRTEAVVRATRSGLILL
jgi:DNA-binding NarL/FixJ family response regulator